MEDDGGGRMMEEGGWRRMLGSSVDVSRKA